MSENKDLSRRDFVIRSGAVIGAGLLMSSPVGALAADSNNPNIKSRGDNFK
ncbi:hypothetical protein [Dickeya chrysanthemi]|uniref:hypothetical protein n=1 Tax=Dickeya chrysanthemi TaxID=556 RepID=UPI003019E92E